MSSTLSRTISAEFEALELVVDLAGTGSGVVTSTPAGIACEPGFAHSFEVTDVVELFAKPDLRSRFGGWEGDCNGTARCRVTISSAHHVIARFNARNAPVTTMQAANLVLGQLDFVSRTFNSGGESLSSLVQPIDCASDGTHLWVADSGNLRVLQWNSPPAVNKAAANVVLGQGAYWMHSPLTTRSGIRGTSGVASDGQTLYVVDVGNYRVLGWRGIPTLHGQDADFLVGQAAFDVVDAPESVNRETPAVPAAPWAGAGVLMVADEASRILIWRTGTSTGGLIPADLVIGQPDFISNATFPVTASSLQAPLDVFFDDVSNRLFVPDRYNHRVLVWRGMPTTNGAPADYVLGQTGFENGNENAGGGSTPSRLGLSNPESVLVIDGDLFVADTVNRRILVWAGVPDSTGELPAAVLGQPDFVTRSASSTPSEQNFSHPVGMCNVGTGLYVADDGFNRVLRFELHH